MDAARIDVRYLAHGQQKFDGIGMHAVREYYEWLHAAILRKVRRRICAGAATIAGECCTPIARPLRAPQTAVTGTSYVRIIIAGSFRIEFDERHAWERTTATTNR
jgi:hypothetical protein